MKFTIEVEDFYLEEGDLGESLKEHIKRDVVNQITTALKSKIEDGINKEVRSQVEQTLYRRISTITAEIIATDKIRGRYSNDPEQTLQEFVQSQFTATARDKAPVDEVIKKLAVQFGDEMKKRYDLLFASQLVAKLSGEGLMKEEAVKLLLDK